MHIAVIIPFRGNAAILQWTLEGFARQQLPADATLEVRLCGDGAHIPPVPAALSDRISSYVIHSPRVGISEAKNILLRNRPADVVIFANADTRPTPSFVEAHVRRLLSLPPGSMVLGASPFEHSANPTVFDVLQEQSPMIFFYSELQPHHFYDFRHAWNLNVSIRYADLERAGFFNTLFRPYGFEDLDLAFRVMGASQKSVYFDPAAEVLHRHPMTFDDYLNREELLGIMAPVLRAANPVLFKHLYGTDDLGSLAVAFRTWLDMDRASHAWIYKRLQEWNTLPASALGTAPAGNDRRQFIMTLYQMHIPLKRFAFRLGFLRGLDWRDDARWQERSCTGLWRQALSEHAGLS